MREGSPVADLRWHIVSYPRSGNHAVRTLVEAATGRPTLGCRGNPADPPIHEREPNRRLGLIRIDDPTPVGYKAHYGYEILANERDRCGPMGMLLITRDPVAAISSQIYRVATERVFRRRKRAFGRLGQEVNNYIALLTYFCSFPGKKIHIRFEDLLSSGDENRIRSVRRIEEAVCGRSGVIADEAIEPLLMLARESQDSLGSIDRALMSDIRNSVEKHLRASDVESILALAEFRQSGAMA